MKSIRNLVLLNSFIFTVYLLSTVEVSASELSNEATTQTISQGQPVNFENVQDINEVVRLIDEYYDNNSLNNGISLLAAAGTKWGEGSIEYIDQGFHLVTNYFWVKGSDMVSWNVVGNAQRKVVIAEYESVNNIISHKMKTQQKVNMSPQTQGQVTVSAQAWCYARD